MTVEAGTPSETAERRPGALLLLCMAQFMLILDIAIVNVALPPIAEDLGFSAGNLQLVVTAYALTFGGLLLLGGRLSDLLGRRNMFVWGLTLFTLASLGCGLAPSAAFLVISRALQGVGGALVAPAALSLLTSIFPEGEERNRALGVWSAVAAVGGAAGLLIGGVLTDLAGWRAVFLVTVPLGAVVALASLRALPEGRPESRGGRLDLAGALAATAGLVALVYGLGRGETQGFGEISVVALLLSSVVLLAAFVVIELWVREPLVPFSLFRSRTLTGANVATLLLSAVIIGTNFFLTLYLQQVLSFSPLQTGLAFLPQTLAAAASSGVAARLAGRLGVRTLLLSGMVSLTLGALLLSRLSPNGSYLTDVLPGLLFVSVGLGFGFTVGTLAATSGILARRQGVASGVFNTSQQVGGAVGLAILATVAGAVTESATESSVAGSVPGALTSGFGVAFLVAAGFGLAAALAVWTLVRDPDCQEEFKRRTKLRKIGEKPATVAAGASVHASPCQPAAARVSAGEPRRPSQDEISKTRR